MAVKAGIDRNEWQRLSSLLDEGLSLAAEARASWLDKIRSAEPVLADKLASMLASAVADLDTAEASAPTSSATPSAAGQGHAASVGRLLGDFDRHLARALVEPDLAGKRLGAWQLEAKIGAGGMGQVWRARRVDGLYQAQAAIKLLRGDVAASGLTARFARERTVLARLNHAAIARLLDAGVADGQAFLVLELVPGRSLGAHVRATVPGVAGRVELLLAIAKAVDHAHGQLIVHRDLKPSNVIVTAAGEPKLLDFGIAALSDAERDAAGDGELTRKTGRGLTLGYAAPEQVTGAPIGTAADVFSLGVMLFELVSGELPFGARRLARAAAERALLDDAPPGLRELARRPEPPPSSADATISGELGGPGRPADMERAFGDLEAVLAKALRKDPAQRYGSVRELIDDLERWLRHRPVSVRRGDWRHNLALWYERHRWLALAGVGLLATLVAGLATATWQWQRAEEARRQSQIVTRYLTDMLSEASPDRHGGQWPTVLQLLDRSREQVDTRLADAPDAKLEMLAALITTYRSLNRFDLSMPLAEKWVALAEERYGRDDPRTLEARLEQAGGYQIQGLYDKAIIATEPLIDPLRRAFGPQSRQLRNALYTLNSSYTRTGRTDDAEKVLAEAGAITAATFAADHPVNGSHLNHLHVLRAGQGRLRDALAAIQKTQVWWPNPPADYQREVLVWRRNTAAIQLRLAEYDGLEQRMRALLSDIERVMGPGNDMGQSLRGELARYYTETGQPQRAHEQRRENLERARSSAVQHVALTVPLRAQVLLAAAQAQAIDAARLDTDGRALLVDASTQAQAIGFPRAEVFIAVARAALALDRAPLAAEAIDHLERDTGLRLDRDKLLAARKLQLDGQLARLRGDLATSRTLLRERRDGFDRAAERQVIPGWAAALDFAYTLVLMKDEGAAAALDDARTRRPPTVPAGHPLDAVAAQLQARRASGSEHAPAAGVASLRGALF